MLRTRVVPCLLLNGKKLVKTKKFKKAVYVGDPINTVRIYNQKEVDELILIDINATTGHNPIQFELIEQIASECFMPICYGGGVSCIEDYDRLFTLGVEKVSVSSLFFEKPELVTKAVNKYGSQSVVFTLDVKRHWLTKKYGVYSHSGSKRMNCSVVDAVLKAKEIGVGEIIVYSIDRDGTWSGFDRELVQQVSSAVNVPVVAVGGAGSLQDIEGVIKDSGASAVGLGSMAVFQGQDMGVLIKFPKTKDLEKLLGD